MKQITEEAKLALEEIIAESEDERLRPRMVLDEARKEDSPLHPYFTWDDDKAAEKCRLQEARSLIVRVKVTVVSPNLKPVRIRAYHSKPSDRQESGGYRSTVQMLHDPEARAEMRESLDAQLRGIQSALKLWEGDPELEPVRTAVDRYLATRDEAKAATQAAQG